MMQNGARRLATRSADRRRDSSVRQPDFRILWKVSIFHRVACRPIFSTASRRERTGRSVRSFHSIGLRPRGGGRSVTGSTVRASGGGGLWFPNGGRGGERGGP